MIPAKIRSKKITFLRGAALCALFFSSNLLAQTTDPEEVINFIPRSPEAAMLGKFGDGWNVGAKGLADISIPLYEVKVDGLTIPISISYLSDGIRVNEEPTLMGLKWVLSCGGIVSRDIVGKPDEFGWTQISNSQFFNNNGWDVTQPPCPSYAYKDFYTNYLDIAPDRFSFSFLGHNGGFLFSQDCGECLSVLQTTTSGLSIAKLTEPISTATTLPGFLGFLIKDTKGNQYCFSAQEMTKITTCNMMGGGCEEPSLYNSGVNGWKLTRIVTPTGDTLTMDYTHNVITNPYYYSKFSFTISGTGVPGQKIMKSREEHQRKHPNKIITPHEIVQFYYNTSGRLLESIAVRDARTREVLKTIFFTYNGLSLVRVEVCGPEGLLNESEVVRYAFAYDEGVRPNFGSYKQDIFGYINLYNRQYHMVPRTGYVESYPAQNPMDDFPDQTEITNPPQSPGGGQLFTPAIRDVDTLHITNGILRKVIYPTGGYTLYDYEPNRHTSADATIYGPGVRVKSMKNYGADGSLLQQRSYEYDFPVFLPYAHKPHSYPLNYNVFIGLPLGIPSPESNYEQTYSSQLLPLTMYKSQWFWRGISTIPIPMPDYSNTLNLILPGHEVGQADDDYFVNALLSGRLSACHYGKVTTKELDNGKQTEYFGMDYNGISINPIGLRTEYLKSNGDTTKVLENLISYTFHDSIDMYYITDSPYPVTVYQCLNGNFYICEAGTQSPELCQYTPPLKKFSFPLRRLKEQIKRDTEYFDNGSKTISLSKTLFNASAFPISIEQSRLNSEVSIGAITHKIRYPSDGYTDYPQGSVGLSGLVQANMLALPIEVEQYVKGMRGDLLLAKGLQVSYSPQGKPAARRVLRNTEPLPASAPRPYEALDGYLYGPMGRNVVQANLQDRVESYRWSACGRYPIAKVVNAPQEDIFHCNFDEIPPLSHSGELFDDPGGSGPGNPMDSLIQPPLPPEYSPDSHTGAYSMKLNTLNSSVNFSLYPSGVGKKFHFSVWAKSAEGYSGGAFLLLKVKAGSVWHTIQLPVPPSEGSWSHVGSTVDLSSYQNIEYLVLGVSFSGSSGYVLVDEVRFHPVEAQMETYTWKPGVGVTSVTDPNGRTVRYAYDGLGRLVQVTDDKGRILEANEYHFAEPLQ